MSTSDEFLSNVDSGKMTSAYRSGWGPDYPSADNYLVQLYDSSSADGKGGNSGNYKNPEFDAMMDKAVSYTHLDVYKRQRSVCWPTMARSTPSRATATGSPPVKAA